METGKIVAISELIGSSLVNVGDTGAFLQILTPALPSPRHCGCSQGFFTHITPPAALQVSLELVMMDTASRVESILALHPGSTQFSERAVPSLARSFVRTRGKKLMEAARSCFPCRENQEELCSLPGTPRDPS